MNGRFAAIRIQPSHGHVKELVYWAKIRWWVEQNYQQLKDDMGWIILKVVLGAPKNGRCFSPAGARPPDRVDPSGEVVKDNSLGHAGFGARWLWVS